LLRNLKKGKEEEYGEEITTFLLENFGRKKKEKEGEERRTTKERNPKKCKEQSGARSIASL
jgi:hypothetical protein